MPIYADLPSGERSTVYECGGEHDDASCKTRLDVPVKIIRYATGTVSIQRIRPEIAEEEKAGSLTNLGAIPNPCPLLADSWEMARTVSAILQTRALGFRARDVGFLLSDEPLKAALGGTRFISFSFVSLGSPNTCPPVPANLKQSILARSALRTWVTPSTHWLTAFGCPP